MDKTKLLKFVNPVLFVSAAIQIITGVLIALHLTGGGSEAVFEIHEHNGFIFAGLVIIHIYLNWEWVKGLLRRKMR